MIINAMELAAAQAGAADPMRIYCLPAAGGAIAAFRGWVEFIPADVALYAVSYSRSAEMRQSIQELACGVADVLPARAEVLLGHSMGALVAFEAIRELRRRGRAQPRCLVVAAERAPHLPHRGPKIHTLPSEELWAQVARLRATPQEALRDLSFRECVEAGLRADFAACETYEYHPAPPLACDILALAGNEDPDVGRDQVEAWRMHTMGGFRFRQIPGDHYFVESHLPTVLTELNSLLPTKVPVAARISK